MFGTAPEGARDPVRDHRPRAQPRQRLRAGAARTARAGHVALHGERRVRPAAAAARRAPLRPRRRRARHASTAGSRTPASTGARRRRTARELGLPRRDAPQLCRRPGAPVPRLRAARRSAGAPFNGRLPPAMPRARTALALGALWRFVDAARARCAPSSRAAATPAASRPTLLAGVMRRLRRAARRRARRRARAAAAHRRARTRPCRAADRRGPLPLDVVRVALAAGCSTTRHAAACPTGAVTFAAMSSLRNLPYRVVCAIGLNDGAFPTAPRPAEFDLMALQPRRGDRQRRVDERNLFLDLLLAARERRPPELHGPQRARQRAAAAVGPGRRTARRTPPRPSTQAPFSPDSLQAARQRLIVEHPLQPFSLEYFKPERRSAPAQLQRRVLRRRCGAAGVAAAAPRRRAARREQAADGDDAEAAGDDEARRRTGRRPLLPARRSPPPGAEWREVTLERPAALLPQPLPLPAARAPRHRARREGVEELQDDEPFLPDVPARSALAGATAAARCSPAPTLADVRALAPRRHRATRRRLRATCVLEQELQRLRPSPRSSRLTRRAAARRRSATLEFDARRRSRGACTAASPTCARAAWCATATTTRAPTIT